MTDFRIRLAQQFWPFLFPSHLATLCSCLLLPATRAFKTAEPLTLQLRVTGLRAGTYRVHLWDTAAGCEIGQLREVVDWRGLLLVQLPPITTDIALAIRQLPCLRVKRKRQRSHRRLAV